MTMMRCRSLYLEEKFTFINNFTNCVFMEEKNKPSISRQDVFSLGNPCSFLWLQLSALQEVHMFGPEGLTALLKGKVAEVNGRSLKSVVVL